MGEERRAAGDLDSWRTLLARGKIGPPGDAATTPPDPAAEIRDRFEALARTCRGEEGQPLTALRILPEGRYGGFRPAGEGGMGIVYWAIDTDLNREVAFKIIRAEPTEVSGSAPDRPMELKAPERGSEASRSFWTSTRRFLQEAWITSGMAHPGIMPVYELGQTPEGIPYYTMRFIRGERTLSTALRETEGTHLEERLSLLEPFLKVCDTLRYAHARGVIHRDLKPANIALGEYGEVVLLDWGMAKLQGATEFEADDRLQAHIRAFREATDLRTVAAAMGTPGYMAPEAALGRGAAMDERSDVYSMGAMLFEILTGRLPFLFSSFGEYAGKLLSEIPPRARDVDDLIPEALSDLCATCLAREPDDRPRSADELATAIRVWQVERERDREVEELLRDARSALAAAEESSGAARVRHLDRAVAACGRVFVRRPDHERATALQTSVKSLREQGVRERERETHRRLLKRVAAVGLAVATAATLLVAVLLQGKREEAERAHDREAAQRARAEDLAMFMLGDLRDELEPVGRLDVLEKVAQKALAYYESVPAETLTAADRRARGLGLGNIGDVLAGTGDYTEAETVLEEARGIFRALLEESPERVVWQRDLTVVLNLLGDVLQERGDLPGAQAHYEEALVIRQGLLRDPSAGAMAHDDVARTLDRVGDVLARRGDRAAALTAYQQSLELRRSLASEDPNDDRWQDALTTSFQKLGDTQVKTGRLTAALANYEAALEMRERALQKRPADTGCQEAVASCLFRVAYIHDATGDPGGARARFERALRMYRRLSALDPSHAWWMRNTALTLQSLAGLAKDRGEAEDARERHEEALSIMEGLAERDPSSVRARHDVAGAHVEVGDVLRSLGEPDAAREHYLRSLALSQALVAQDPAPPEWLDDLATAHERLARLYLAEGDATAAEAGFREAAATARRLVAHDPDNVESLNNLAVHLLKLGDVVRDGGDLPGAMTHYREVEEIRKRLVAHDPERLTWEEGYVTVLNRASDLAKGPAASLARHLKAAAANRRILAHRPDDADRLRELAFSLYGIGIAQESAGRLPEALPSLREGVVVHRRAATLSPRHLPEHHFWTEAYGRVVLALGKDGIKTAFDHLTLAYLRLARREYAQAIELFEVALEDQQIRTDLRDGHLYNAACCAALSNLPRLAIAFLTEDLERRRSALEGVEAELEGEILPENRPALLSWRDALRAHFGHARAEDPDLESLRALPEFQALFE